MPDHLQAAVPLAAHTTFQVGGPARWYTTVTNEAELEAALATAEHHNLPVYILGGGSNLLVADSGVEGLVIKMNITGYSYQQQLAGPVRLTAAAGETLDDVVADSVARGYWGLENLSHIPGSVGATPIQNVGAYGVEVADCIESVRVYDRQQAVWCDLPSMDCQFSYRNSLFKREPERYVVTSVTYILARDPQPQVSYRDLQAAGLNEQSSIAAIREAVIDIRAAKFPDWHRYGTAGSFFKNPIIANTQAAALRERFPEVPVYPVTADTSKVSLGYILDKVCHLRGYQVGAVQVSPHQALVVLTDPRATPAPTAAEIAALADTIAEQVQVATGIDIEWEVTPWGSFS